MKRQEWQEYRDETREIWETNAAFWDEYMGEAGNDFALQLVFPVAEHLLKLQAGEHLLEIACGNGTFARRVAAQGVFVTATDFSEMFVSRASSRGGKGITYHQLDATDHEQLLAVPGGPFDAVVCNMALMDMAVIQPLFDTLPQLINPDGRFVFTLTHPCFNTMTTIQYAELEDQEGELVLHSGVKISQYLTSTTGLGLGIRGQPVAQRYFDRPLHQILGVCFQAGWVVDGLEEPAFPTQNNPGPQLNWKQLSEIPPVLAVRLRLAT